MMHDHTPFNEAFHDARRAIGELNRRDAARALLSANRAAAVIRDGDRCHWHAIRVAGGVGVRPVLNDDGKPVRDDAGQVVTVNDNRESVIIDSLCEAGIDAYCPRDVKVKRSPRKKSGVKFAVPMFPTYAFVRLPARSAAYLGVVSFEGVRGFVSTPSGPLVVPAKLVDEIKVYEALKPKDRRMICSVVKVGDRMAITRNVWQGFTGEVVSVDGKRGLVDLELSLFGRATRVTLGLDDAKKLG